MSFKNTSRFSKLLLLFAALSVFPFSLAVAGEEAGAVSSANPPSYTVRAGDKLNVQVYRERELSGVFTVDASGKIHYPLLGSLMVGGLSTDQVQKLLTEGLVKDYLVDPKVRVDFEVSLNKSLVILGHVGKPGTYDFTPDLTLIRLVSQAGGFGSLAAPNRVKIVRTNADGTKQTIQANVRRILDGKADDVPLQAGDLVVVPESIF
ncbi:MAG: polysaccharide export protein [Candidatus Omnitrophica bacterium]|nr:polysaccharide export protein [Candidatus Omnitrophota bacterium]